MNESVFDPPNWWLLSDHVIGTVVLRSKKLSDPLDSTRMNISSLRSYRPELQTPERHTPCYETATGALQCRGGDDSEPFLVNVESPEAPQHDFLASSTREGPAQHHQQELDIATAIKLTKAAIQRRDRRDKQRRYRKKQRDMVIGLEQETEKLRKHIDRLLEQQQRALARALPRATCVWNVVAEYFRLFEYGLLELKSAQQHSSSSSDAVEGIDVSSEQLRFLRSALAADVVSNEGRGVGPVVYSCRCASLWLSDFKLELQGLHKIGFNAVVATTKTTFAITEHTLRNLFPSVWKDRESPLGSAVVDKLLGQSVSMCGTTRFEWDSARCRLTSLWAQSDLLTPLLRLLGTLEDVERVFAKALISPDFRWVARS